MKVIILGCGPAGLLAAYACEQYGHDVTIVSTKIKSTIPGAVFLHQPVPGLTAPTADGAVSFVKHGTKEGYAKKVYGNQDADCSWDLFPEGLHPAWSMFDLYNKLWMMYQRRIIDIKILPNDIQFFNEVINVGLVISTIPAKLICKNKKHSFDKQTIHVLNRTVDSSLQNGIVYNGNPNDIWYRTSKIFGAEATEATVPFPRHLVRQCEAKTSTGYKPIKTDCDCHPGVARIGRFGRWEKGILVHHAYDQTVQLLREYT